MSDSIKSTGASFCELDFPGRTGKKLKVSNLSIIRIENLLLYCPDLVWALIIICIKVCMVAIAIDATRPGSKKHLRQIINRVKK